MTIKKPMKTAKPTLAATSGAEAAPAAGGATIADRFKLDTTAPDKKGGTVNKKAAMIALIAGILGLCASGGLVYMLYQHWEFLMPA